jgi:hypothetical protein
MPGALRHRLRDECDARVTLHILGDCKLHTAFVASQDDKADFNELTRHPEIYLERRLKAPIRTKLQ